MNKRFADKIITEYLAKIYGFSVKKSFSYDEAEDICSEIIQELYPSLLKTKKIFNIEGYVWRICEHVYSKYVSQKKKHEGISIDGVEFPFYDDYFDGEDEEQIFKLRREIAFLTERRRKIVFMFYYKNLSVSDISKEIGIPEGTVKWHLNKARNELKEGFSMKRKIGKLGLEPVEAANFSHNGNPGKSLGPETYLGDKINLNIVYSVYHSPKTKEEIAEELGVTLVYIEDRIDYLEANGFLVKTSGQRYTTYVVFTPGKYSSELFDKKLRIQHEISETLIREYVPTVREAVAALYDEIYIPGGNRELLEAFAIFFGIINKCGTYVNKDLSPYNIITTDGGDYTAYIELNSKSQSETEQKFSYWSCGPMSRLSVKYPSVCSFSVDSNLSSRVGRWQNNLVSDYEYLYEFICGMLSENSANEEKFKRLRERGFLTDDNTVNIMIVKESQGDFFNKIPVLDESIRERFADIALEYAMAEAKGYPAQIQDLIVCNEANGLIGNVVALMVMEQLYSDGTFKPLSDREKITSNLIMFSDTLPVL